MKSSTFRQLRLCLSFVFLFLCTFNAYTAPLFKHDQYAAGSDKKEIVLKAISTAQQFDKENKTKKAITELEKVLTLVKSINEDALLEQTYELLWSFNKKINNKKKTTEYGTLYSIAKTTREIKELEVKNKHSELLLTKSESKIDNLENEKIITEHVIDSTTHELLVTKDSLGILELINTAKQTQITLLNKEKQLKDLKVIEQALIIKEKEARQQLTWIIIASLLLGLLTLSTLAYYIYKNLQQKKKHNKEQEVQLNLIQHQHDNITNSINYAQRIQNAMLPHEHHLEQFIPESFVLLKPKDIVSGDFHWFYNMETGNTINELSSKEEINKLATSKKIIIAAVDCTGHGVPGAFMSMIAYNALNTIASKKIHEPNIILAELNKSIYNALQQHKTENKDGMDMALCTIDTERKVIEFAGAKNPIIIIKNGVLETIKGDREPIGGSQGTSERVYTKHTIAIDQPTTLYLMSDGYEDQFGGPENKKFMIKYLKELLLQIYLEPFEKQKEILNNTIEAWKGTTEKQIDDILIIGLRVQ